MNTLWIRRLAMAAMALSMVGCSSMDRAKGNRALKRSLVFDASRSEVRQALAPLLTDKGAVQGSRGKLLQQQLGGQNLSTFILTTPSAQLKGFDYHFPDGVNTAEIVANYVTHNQSLIRPLDVKQYSWVRTNSKAGQGQFWVETPYGLVGKFLFQARRSWWNWRIVSISVAKTSSDIISEGYPVFKE